MRTANGVLSTAVMSRTCPNINPSPAAPVVSTRANSSRIFLLSGQHPRVLGDPAADDGEDGPDEADLVLRNGEVVAVEDDQVAVEARFDRPQRLVVEEPAVAARRRLQCLLTGDLLPRVDGLAEEVLAGDQEPERDEGIRGDDVTAVGVEADGNPAIEDPAGRRPA